MSVGYEFVPLGGNARRQYINSRELFFNYREAARRTGELEGDLRWLFRGGREHLIRVLRDGRWENLGVRSRETEALYAEFVARRALALERFESLQQRLTLHTDLNHALSLGRVDSTTIGILNSFYKAGIDEDVIVIGASALYCYEFAAGVQLQRQVLSSDAIDPLRRENHLTLATVKSIRPKQMLRVLRAVDKSFALKRQIGIFVAVNDKGYQVSLYTRSSAGVSSQQRRDRRYGDDFWTAKPKDLNWILSAPKIDSVLVGTSGVMARMTTVDPRAFVLFKIWASCARRGWPLRTDTDKIQACLVVRLIDDYLHQFDFADLGFSTSDIYPWLLQSAVSCSIALNSDPEFASKSDPLYFEKSGRSELGSPSFCEWLR